MGCCLNNIAARAQPDPSQIGIKGETFSARSLPQSSDHRLFPRWVFGLPNPRSSTQFSLAYFVHRFAAAPAETKLRAIENFSLLFPGEARCRFVHLFPLPFLTLSICCIPYGFPLVIAAIQGYLGIWSPLPPSNPRHLLLVAPLVHATRGWPNPIFDSRSFAHEYLC
jgi:hypothetical protein